MKNQDNKTPGENSSPEELRNEITRLREQLKSEQARTEFLLSAIDSLPNPIFIKDSDAKFVFFNRNYSDFFGMDRQTYIGKSVMELTYLSEEDRKRYQEEDLKLIESSSILHYDVDFTTHDGEVCPSFYWSSGFTTPNSHAKGLVGEIVDITKERHLSDQLKVNISQLEEANHTIMDASRRDAMTGLYNRHILKDRVTPLLSNAGKTKAPLCFLMTDLDHFKRVNDTFGHLVGDQILAEFAQILKDSCRESDLPIRYGGEEFLIFLYDADLSAGQKIAERIREKTARELLLPDGSALTASFGVAQYQHGDSLHECLTRADAALYRAKETGRNRVVADE